mgnify:FL=1
MNDIEQIGLEDIVNFFHHKLCLNNYAISVIGKYNYTNISRYIDKMFRHIQLKKPKHFLQLKEINYPTIKRKVRIYIRINKLNYEYVENMVCRKG